MGESNEVLRFDDLVIDVGARKVRRGTTELPVGGLSFEFLLALARAAPDAVAADELIAAVWDQSAVTDETLQQRARLVRQALGDDGSEKRYIENIRGYGYRLVPPVTRGRRSAAEVPSPQPTTVDSGRATYRYGLLLRSLVVVALLLVITWIAMLMRTAKQQRVPVAPASSHLRGTPRGAMAPHHAAPLGPASSLLGGARKGRSA